MLVVLLCALGFLWYFSTKEDSARWDVFGGRGFRVIVQLYRRCADAQECNRCRAGQGSVVQIAPEVTGEERLPFLFFSCVRTRFTCLSFICKQPFQH